MSDRAALVTGAAGGIGGAVCHRLARAGFMLHLVDADYESLIETQKSIANYGIETTVMVIDFLDPVAIESGVKHILQHGPIDALVNNAGTAVACDLPSTKRDDWHRIFSVNVHAIYEICRLVIPAMIEKGGGAVVNVASVAALVGIKQRAAYCASKGAVVSLSRAMAADHAADNIRVNALCPGTVHTGWIDSILAGQADPEAARAAMEGRQLLGRLGEPAEIAEAVHFLICNEFATGSAMVLDGGMTTT